MAKTTTTFDPAKLAAAQAKLTKLNDRVARLRNKIRNLQAAEKRSAVVKTPHGVLKDGVTFPEATVSA